MHRPILLFLLILSAFLPALSQSALKVGAPVPDFKGTSLDGKTYDSAALRGSTVVMTFWSSRCPICHSEIPKLNQLAARYERHNVVFLALTPENEEQVTPYLRRNAFRFTVLPNSFGILLDYADRTRNGSIDMGYPSYFVVDQRGRLSYRGSGWDRTEALESELYRLTAQ